MEYALKVIIESVIEVLAIRPCSSMLLGSYLEHMKGPLRLGHERGPKEGRGRSPKGHIDMGILQESPSTTGPLIVRSISRLWPQYSDPWAQPRSRSTLGFQNLHHRSIGVRICRVSYRGGSYQPYDIMPYYTVFSHIIDSTKTHYAILYCNTIILSISY